MMTQVRDRQTQASNILEASAKKEVRISPELENWKNSLKSLYRLQEIYAPIPVLRQKIGRVPKEFTKQYGETSKMYEWAGGPGAGGVTQKELSTKCPVHLLCLSTLKLDLSLQTELQTNFFIDSSLNLNGQSSITRHLRKATI